MPSSPATRHGTRKLSEVARVVSKPTGITATGWGDVETICNRMGVEFDEWQKGVGRLALAKRSNGNLAAMIDGVGLSLPRQVGKTYLMSGLVFALCVLRPGTLAIWTAQHSSTHEETFLSMQGFAARHRVKPFIDRVYTGSGDEEVRFNNGSRILFGARERGFGRGIPGVDVLVFDEAQHLSERALDAMVATMNTSRFGLSFYIGTPPRPEDNSESFSRMRQDALEGKLGDGVWVECGADPDAGPDDREQWAKANPSYPGRTPAESILRLRSKLTEESFMREALGIWDAQSTDSVIDPETWSAARDEASVPVDSLALAVDISPDRRTASVSLAGRRADGSWHVELDEHRRGTSWVAGWIEERCSLREVRAVVVDRMSPAASLIDELAQRKIKVTATSAGDMATACANFYDGVMDRRVHHIDQPQLSYSLSVARKRDLQGAWGWNRKDSTSDITPIVSATLALWGAQNSQVKKPTRKRASSESRRAVVL